MGIRSIFQAAVLAALASPLAAPASPPDPPATVDVAAYVRADRFEQIKISPGGDYFAATVPLDDGERTGLVIMSRADNAITGTFSMGRHTHIDDFHWVNPERVLIGVAEKLGALEAPQPTGELIAINADGSQRQFLVGQRMMGEGPGTRIQTRRVEQVAAFLADPLVNDDRNVIISVMPFSADPFTRADLMDVYTGRRTPLARAPVRNARFVTDNAGVVRFASGSGVENRQRLYYRACNGQ